jgi:hypothetical protein
MYIFELLLIHFVYLVKKINEIVHIVGNKIGGKALTIICVLFSIVLKQTFARDILL